MRFSGDTTTASTPIRRAWTAAEIAAGELPYITTSQTLSDTANERTEEKTIAAETMTLFIFSLVSFSAIPR